MYAPFLLPPCSSVQVSIVLTEPHMCSPVCLIRQHPIVMSRNSSLSGIPHKYWSPKWYPESIFTNDFCLSPPFSLPRRILTFLPAAAACELPLNFVQCWGSNYFISLLDAASLGIEVHLYSTWHNSCVSHIYFFLSNDFWALKGKISKQGSVCA